MKRGEFKLTAAKVKHLSAPGRYSDGHGLWLQITKAGNKSWIFRYERGGVAGKRGKATMMGLGALHAVTLAEARDMARELRLMLISGTDPLEAKRAAKLDALTAKARQVTFGQCVEDTFNSIGKNWKNAKHRAQWRSSIFKNAPNLLPLPVDKVDVHEIVSALEKIWSSKPSTAERVRGRIERVLDYATARKLRSGDNPARWKGNLKHLLSEKGTGERRHAALPYNEIPALMAELREAPSVPVHALEFTILTSARTGDALGATWDEIDLDKAEWTIPAERMKMAKEHRVPLSNRAVEILRSLQKSKSGWVFTANGRKPLGHNAMGKTLKNFRPNVTVHGFRSTFSTWAREMTPYPSYLAEMALAHKAGSKVELAYMRGDLFLKRRQLMDKWAAYCASAPRSETADVVPIRGAM
jgi:integrase